MSGYCDNCIDVVLQLTNEVTLNQVVDGSDITYIVSLAALSIKREQYSRGQLVKKVKESCMGFPYLCQ